MALNQGIMAGIGDIANDINVITPQFDAIVNNFIIGQEGIIEGFDLNGNILSAGICVAKGYRGQLNNSITTTSKYIYGVFKVYFDNTKLDEFYIETSDNPLDNESAGISFGDDILHEPGEYHLVLYAPSDVSLSFQAGDAITTTSSISASGDYTNQKFYYLNDLYDNYQEGDIITNVELVGTSATSCDLSFTEDYIIATIHGRSPNTTYNFVAQITILRAEGARVKNKINYPLNAENADNTDHLNDNGSIGDNVTCPTAHVNDNSNKIASTEYVHNQIEEEINYTPLNYNQSKSYNFNDAFGATAVLTFNFNFQGKKKAKLCVIDRIDFSITHTGVDSVDTSISANTVLATLPEDFKPINNVVIVPREYFSSNNTAIGFGIDTNGNVYNIDAMNSPRETYPDKVWYNVGYETQV